MKLHSIEALIDLENLASAKVLEKCNLLDRDFKDMNSIMDDSLIPSFIRNLKIKKIFQKEEILNNI